MLVLLLLLLLSATSARILHKPREFRCSSLVVFGDSFSDDGVEADRESHGFVRNCNGKVWNEYVQDMLQCEQYTNYAYSGAKSNNDNFYFEGWSGINWQVEKFLGGTPQLSNEPLIILQAGGAIDFFTGERDPQIVVKNAQDSITNLTESMESGTLVVISVMDVSGAPGVRTAEEGEELRKRLTELTAETNRQLSRVVLDPDVGTKKLHPKIRVRFIDVNPIVMSAMQNLNTSQPFTHHEGSTKPRSVFKYAFHDLWNPSTIVHYQLAREIVRQLQDF